MANWRYEGLSQDGKRVDGTVDAKDERDARKKLRAQGVRVKKVLPPSFLEFDIGQWLEDKGIGQSFGLIEIKNFTKQLAIMISAGVPILQCMEILYKSEKNITLKNIIKEVAREVGEGKTISEALEKQKGFDKLYCSLVKAGETGGILDTILNKLAEHMEKQQKTRSQIKSALTYPVIVSIIGAGVIWAMLVFVVPQFTGMLQDTGQEIPAITQLVIDTSNFLGDYALMSIPVVIVFVAVIKNFLQTDSGKELYDRLSMKAPVFGGIVIKGNLASFCRTLSTMLGAGVSLVDALDICMQTIDNVIINKDLQVVKKSVIEGKTLSEPLNKITYFPDMVTQMIKVGEQTGAVDQMLMKVAEVFEDEVSELVGNMTKMFEPIIIVVLGGIIAAILVAMYLPMFMSAGGN